MNKNLFIVFTTKEGAPQSVGLLLTENFSDNNILSMTSESVSHGVNDIHDKPDVLVINDSYTFDNNGIKSKAEKLIAKNEVQKVYVVYHNDPKGEIKETTANQRKAIRKICKNKEKLLYEAVEHHNKGNPAADALSKIIEALPKNGDNGNKELYKQGLEDLLNKPIYADPHLESLIHLHKSLSLIPLKKNLNPEDEINTLKEDDKYKLAFKKFKPEDFNSINLEDKLNEIAKAITKHSTMS